MMRITPYLETASKSTGYGIASAAAEAMLYANEARVFGDNTLSDVIKREVYTPDGKLTFFSRARLAGEEYRDAAGRPITRVDGICVADDPDGNFKFNPDYLDKAAAINDHYFEKFWTRTDRGGDAEVVTEEIAARDDLPEMIENVIVREPYGAPKKNQPHEPGGDSGTTAKAEHDGRSEGRDPPRDNLYSDRGVGGSGGEARAASGREAGSAVAEAAGRKPGLAFQACTVGLGAVGIGLMAHGILKWFSPPKKDDTKSGSAERRPLLRLVEVGAGAGMTWAAFVQAKQGNLLQRLQ